MAHYALSNWGQKFWNDDVNSIYEDKLHPFGQKEGFILSTH